MAKPKKRDTQIQPGAYVPGGLGKAPENYRDSQGRKARTDDWNWGSNWFQMTQPQANDTVFVATSEGDRLATYSYVNGEMVRTGGPSLEEGTQLVYTGNRTTEPEKSWYGDEYYFVEVQNPQTGETYWVAENWVAGDMPTKDDGTVPPEIISEPPEENKDDGGGGIPIIPIPGRAQKNREGGQPGKSTSGVSSGGPVGPNQNFAANGLEAASNSINVDARGTNVGFNTQAYEAEQRLKAPLGNPEMPAINPGYIPLTMQQSGVPIQTQGYGQSVIADRRSDAIENRRANGNNVTMPATYQVGTPQQYGVPMQASGFGTGANVVATQEAAKLNALFAGNQIPMQRFGTGLASAPAAVPARSAVAPYATEGYGDTMSVTANSPQAAAQMYAVQNIPMVQEVQGASLASPGYSQQGMLDYTTLQSMPGFYTQGAPLAPATVPVATNQTAYVASPMGYTPYAATPMTPWTPPATMHTPIVTQQVPWASRTVNPADYARYRVVTSSNPVILDRQYDVTGQQKWLNIYTNPATRPAPTRYIVHSPLGDAGPGGGVAGRYSGASVRAGMITDPDNP